MGRSLEKKKKKCIDIKQIPMGGTTNHAYFGDNPMIIRVRIAFEVGFCFLWNISLPGKP